MDPLVSRELAQVTVLLAHAPFHCIQYFFLPNDCQGTNILMSAVHARKGCQNKAYSTDTFHPDLHMHNTFSIRLLAALCFITNIINL